MIALRIILGIVVICVYASAVKIIVDAIKALKGGEE